MTNRNRLSAAGNTLAPALGILRELGYTVMRGKSGERQYRAENETCVFSADEPLTLLGLVKMYEIRGSNWQPNDEEVRRFLLFENEEE
jgi:hypothetical protein